MNLCSAVRCEKAANDQEAMPERKKPVIDIALVGRLVADQFPQWAHLPVMPVAYDGWDNRTFCLGNELSVRLPSAEGYAAQVPKEHRWLPLLAPHLPKEIPVPVALGSPTADYPFHWSVYRWLVGEIALHAQDLDKTRLAVDVADFITCLHLIPVHDGPKPGKHNFLRGGSLQVYDRETRDALAVLGERVDQERLSHLWTAALGSKWQHPPVWVHGDMAPTNLLIREGRLRAVIDFGCCAVGDPACDLVIAWTFFEGESRNAFRDRINLDDDTWARARGWALWKSLILLANQPQSSSFENLVARRVIDDIIAEYRRE
jgi:aminoglycoside phosphotransferase (APT) family kinase protein